MLRRWMVCGYRAIPLVFALLLAVLPGPARAYGVAGTQILDGTGRPIHLRGVSWFGFETESHAVHGLHARAYGALLDQMQAIGVNAVRLPFCPPVLRGAKPSGIDYTRNPDLAGLDALGVLDRIVQAADARGMYVVLDHHRPDCKRISPLWYTLSYSEAEWIADLVFVARRYAALPHFLGIDLKNEPHGMATWGLGVPARDWNRAAERAAAAVLQAAPDLLIFVQGVGSNRVCTSETAHWWGGDLEAVDCFALEIRSDRLVLSPHTYGPNVYLQPYFLAEDFPANLPPIWEQHFGRFAPERALVLGEFGSAYGAFGDPREVAWFEAFVPWLIQRGVTHTFFWSWNPNSSDTGGLLQDDWQTLHQGKLALLQRLWDSPPLGTPAEAVGADGDGIPAPLDNCPAVPNPDQADAGGLATPDDPNGGQRDGVGNACQCGDVTGDGRATAADADLIARCARGLAPCGPTRRLAAVGRCDVNGDASCDAADSALLWRVLRGRAGEIPVRCAAPALR
jgi:endoglucanase